MSSAEKNELALESGPRPGAFGRFYLQELINSGGMADIWLATDSAGQPFALRKLHDRLRFNFVSRRRFLRGKTLKKHGKCNDEDPGDSHKVRQTFLTFGFLVIVSQPQFSNY